MDLVNNSYLGSISKNFANGHSSFCVAFSEKYIGDIPVVRQTFTRPTDCRIYTAIS